MQDQLNVLFCAAEAAPLVKIGGLGDVAGSLPGELKKLGQKLGVVIDIRLVIPFYDVIDEDRFDIQPLIEFTIPHSNGHLLARVSACSFNDIPVYLIDSPFMSNKGRVYDEDASKDAEKFTFYSLAALELAQRLGWRPDILHAHDWHTAASVYALSLTRPCDPFWFYTASLLTVHNLPYLGKGAGFALEDFGLPPIVDSALPEWSRKMPLPIGLLAADHVNAVSPGYAAEILTPEFGSGLHEFLNQRKGSISGILNGLDVQKWDPETDPHIDTRYNAESLHLKRENKRALREEAGLPHDEKVPLIGIISRMDPQKGIDLALQALEQCADRPWQIVILGKGQPGIEAAVKNFETRFPGRARVWIDFDAPLGHRIYAGADLLLIPSRYEPCGLTQMIAMRYGTVPIGRATGGLKDTIQDYGQEKHSTGFLFVEQNPEALAVAVRRALKAFSDQRIWKGLQRRGMRQDFSWEKSAREYYHLYRSIQTKRLEEVQ